jgi:hypothetical protein
MKKCVRKSLNNGHFLRFLNLDYNISVSYPVHGRDSKM